MLIKVIYSDGSNGMLKTSRLAKLVKMNRIAAYANNQAQITKGLKEGNIVAGKCTNDLHSG